MLKITTTILIAYVFILSCDSENKSKTVNSPSKYVYSSVLIDTLEQKTTSMQLNTFGKANYIPFYIGPIGDSIYIDYRLLPYLPPPPPPPLEGYESDTSEFGNYEKYRELFDYKYYDEEAIEVLEYVKRDSADIEIFVDVKKQIRNVNFDHFQDGTFAFHAYPVYVTNISSEHAAVGYGQYIDLILEAKDKDGKWEPLEKGFKYGCGTGIEDIVLPPSQIVLTSVPIFNGSYRTLLRLRQRYGVKVSNEFEGNINLGQFKREE